MHEVTVPGEEPEQDPLDDAQAALAAAVLEMFRYVGTDALPRPRCFALVATGAMLRDQPAFAQLLDEATIEAAESDPHHVTAIEVEAGEESDPVQALARMTWPTDVAGAAIVCDLSSEHWMSGPSAPGAAERIGDGALRAVTAALVEGTTWSAVRGDQHEDLLMGASLLPDITDALASSLEEPEAS